MAYEQRDNSGSIFKNEKKTTDNHPNMTGKCLIGGVEYWVSAWTKDGTKGKWQSLAFKPCGESAPAKAKHEEPNSRNGAAFDDEIPF